MTDTAILDVNDDVVLARLSAFERIGCERSLGGHRGIAFAFAHDCDLSFRKCQMHEFSDDIHDPIAIHRVTTAPAVPSVYSSLIYFALGSS